MTWTGEGNFAMFPHFSGISSPGGFRGSVGGKTTRNTKHLLIAPGFNCRYSRGSLRKAIFWGIAIGGFQEGGFSQ